MKITIIIPVHNGRDDTLECLESLEAAIDQREHDVLVVNNGSTDGTAAAIVECFPFVDLLTNPSNQSFSKSVNQGARYAWRNGAEAILLLNNDTVVTRNFLAPLIDMMERCKKYGAISPLISYYDKREIIWYAGGDVKVETGKLQHIGIGKNKSFALGRYCNYATGCCMLIRRECFEHAGGFDEKFYFYGEDADFCLRAKMVGWWIACETKSEIFHKVSRSSTPLQKIRMKLAGEARLLWKHNKAIDLPRAYAGFVIFNLWRLFKKIK